jgi:hypothetical protein
VPRALEAPRSHSPVMMLLAIADHLIPMIPRCTRLRFCRRGDIRPQVRVLHGVTRSGHGCLRYVVVLRFSARTRTRAETRGALRHVAGALRHAGEIRGADVRHDVRRRR